MTEARGIERDPGNYIGRHRLSVYLGLRGIQVRGRMFHFLVNLSGGAFK